MHVKNGNVNEWPSHSYGIQIKLILQSTLFPMPKNGSTYHGSPNEPLISKLHKHSNSNMDNTLGIFQMTVI